MNKTTASIIVALVLVGAGTWMYKTGVLKTTQNKAEDTHVSEQPAQQQPNDTSLLPPVVTSTAKTPAKQSIKDLPPLAKPPVAQAPSVREFTVTGSNYSFTPAYLTVKKGDTVRITFKNSTGFHDLKIDEFSVATKKISAGTEETVEFVASKAGSFEYYCSVGNHRAMGMKGTLTIGE